MKKTELKQIIREEILKEIGANDPVLAAVRASKDARLKNDAEWKARLAKRVYGKERERLEDLLEQINDKLSDLYRERSNVFDDQEVEAGQGNWSDADANRYGDRLNKIESQIEKLLSSRSKLEVKLAY